jgi:PBSX family phage terminase large subunit
MSLAFVQWSMHSFNGQNFGMCGKTVGSFRRNVLSVLKQMLPARGYTIRDRRTDNLVVISRGSIENYYYIFGGKDEGSQDLVQGITLAGILLDEIALMPESFVNQATGRCSVDGSKFWCNCNPAGPEHWFKKQWIDEQKKRRAGSLPVRICWRLTRRGGRSYLPAYSPVWMKLRRMSALPFSLRLCESSPIWSGSGSTCAMWKA